MLVHQNRKWMYILVYVDDLIIAHKDDQAIAEVSGKLNRHFEVRDLGQVTLFGDSDVSGRI